MNHNAAGLGDINAKLIFYIKNRPTLTRYENLACVRAMQVNEIKNIGDETGNHWRKVFNVYAKLLFELSPMQFSSWQNLRDNYLLQADSKSCLLFSPPNIPPQENDKNANHTKLKKGFSEQKLHIILGKGYAESLALGETCTWLNHEFAVNFAEGIIICPYFDYRQLSNIKIAQLVRIIQQLLSAATNEVAAIKLRS